VQGGIPAQVDAGEPLRIAKAVKELGLCHVVITSVTRDDLSDGGASHFVACLQAIRLHTPEVVLEVLTPDFNGNREAINVLVHAHPEIYNHNVETVPRLYPKVRAQAQYTRSLSLLEQVKSSQNSIYTKSGLMVGLGENFREIEQVLKDLRNVGCDIVTIGQYLRPSTSHVEVQEYVHPTRFMEYKTLGESMGFLYVASAPFVRSSFNAKEFSMLHLTNYKNGATLTK
jgi:lipoic acid synthetase